MNGGKMIRKLNENESKALQGRFDFSIDLPSDYDERIFVQELAPELQNEILKKVKSIETLEQDVWVHWFSLEIGMLYVQKMEYKAIVKNDELVVEETAFIAVSKLIRKHIIHGSGWCGFRSGYSVDGYRFKMIIHNEGFDEIIFEKNSRRVVVVLCNYNSEKSVVKIC
jgi:uncharacterized metal-binding protein